MLVVSNKQCYQIIIQTSKLFVLKLQFINYWVHLKVVMTVGHKLNYNFLYITANIHKSAYMKSHLTLTGGSW